MSSSNRHKVGALSDFPEGQAVSIDVDGTSIVVCNYQGKLYALENRCSHDDAELGCGELDGHQVICPRHQAKFDIRDGSVTEAPAVYPIETFWIEVRGKSVFVELND